MKLWNGEEIDPDQHYRLLSVYFMSKGKDGFDMFLDESVTQLTDEADAKTLHNIIYGFLEQLNEPETTDS